MYTMLCIPRIENATKLEYVRSIFNKMNIGNIKSVFEIPLHANTEYKRVMIQMDINKTDDRGSFILDRINMGKNVKIVHNKASYWKVVMSRMKAG